jgi:hypothetical protein
MLEYINEKFHCYKLYEFVMCLPLSVLRNNTCRANDLQANVGSVFIFRYTYMFQWHVLKIGSSINEVMRKINNPFHKMLAFFAPSISFISLHTHSS